MEDQPKLGERHLAGIIVSTDILLSMMQIGFKITGETTKGLPAGAVFVGSHFDIRAQEVIFFFSHPSLPIVENGCEIPIIPWEIRS